MAGASRTTRYTLDDDEDLNVAIVKALSEAKGRDISEEGRVLYQAIDPDALASIFRERGSDHRVTVEFTTHDAIVVIQGNGSTTIEVQDFEPSEE